jgi:hypothetical protein
VVCMSRDVSWDSGWEHSVLLPLTGPEKPHHWSCTGPWDFSHPFLMASFFQSVKWKIWTQRSLRSHVLFLACSP